MAALAAEWGVRQDCGADGRPAAEKQLCTKQNGPNAKGRDEPARSDTSAAEDLHPRKAKRGLSVSTEESPTGRSGAKKEEDRRESAVPNLRGSGDSRKAGTTTKTEYDKRAETGIRPGFDGPEICVCDTAEPKGGGCASSPTRTEREPGSEARAADDRKSEAPEKAVGDRGGDCRRGRATGATQGRAKGIRPGGTEGLIPLICEDEAERKEENLLRNDPLYQAFHYLATHCLLRPGVPELQTAYMPS